MNNDVHPYNRLGTSVNNPGLFTSLFTHRPAFYTNKNLRNVKNQLGITYDDITIYSDDTGTVNSSSGKNWTFTSSRGNASKKYRTGNTQRGSLHIIKVNLMPRSGRGGHTFAAWLLTSENGHRGLNSKGTYLYVVDTQKGSYVTNTALLLSQYYNPNYVRIYKGMKLQENGTSHCSWIAKKLLTGTEFLSTVAAQVYAYKKLNFAELDRTVESVLQKESAHNKMCKLNRTIHSSTGHRRVPSVQANFIAESIKKRLKEHKGILPRKNIKQQLSPRTPLNGNYMNMNN
jgi:hypothetical protein